LKEAGIWSAVWIALAFLFNAGVWIAFGQEKALSFLAAYLVEKSLSVDNIFVFVAIFAYFAVSPTYQHRLLFWGILGALLMRGLFIWAGIELLERFHWLTYLLGFFLVVTGFRFAKEDEGVHPEHNPVIRFVQRLLPVTQGYRGQAFLVREAGTLMATPLLLVLLVVEMTDVVFAIDSVPAVLAISSDPFIVYTSNIFAILGLRALYFVLSGVIPRFAYLRYGLCAILVFVGVKMLLVDLLRIPIQASLGLIAFFLAISVGFSLFKTRPIKQ
jgi:tellurite resistance protein TerC